MDEVEIIRKEDMTRNGSLTNKNIQRIKQHLLHHDLVLLPSDTCYSLAFCAAFAKEEYDQLNVILNRKDEPISLAFPSVLVAESYITFNLYSWKLLERFTPGPLTIVCKVTDSKNKKILEIVRSKDETVGVRIPDSQIERQVAGSTLFPITTIAVRDEKKMVIQDFQAALRKVQDGMKKLRNRPRLIAIEGAGFFNNHSTIVKVDERGNCVLIRAGEIDFEKIKQVVRSDYPHF